MKKHWFVVKKVAAGFPVVPGLPLRCSRHGVNCTVRNSWPGLPEWEPGLGKQRHRVQLEGLLWWPPCNVFPSVPTDPIRTTCPWAQTSATPSSRSSAERSTLRITEKGMKQICSRTACVMGKAALTAPRSSLPGNARHGAGDVLTGFGCVVRSPVFCVRDSCFLWVCTSVGLREGVPAKLWIQGDARLGTGREVASLGLSFS